MAETTSKKRKLKAAVAAVAAAAVLLVGGTFAWQSISQTALNEASDVINPGGRLHDDFNGTSKDIYVENFAEDPIYARVRLSEYMEIIANYNVDGVESSTQILGSKAAVTDDEGNETGEYTYNYETFYFDGNVDENGVVSAGGTDNEGNPYWSWTTGGSTVYMPTFNMNKDSLAADINGNYVDAVGGISNRDGDQYENYVEYTDGETITGTEIYDSDSNDQDDEGVTKIDGVEHTAKSTEYGELISMSDWLESFYMYNEETDDFDLIEYDENVHGNFWVYDTDGWVYWSSPIEPDTATGLLLDGIEQTQVMDDTWYYAINVEAQFVTADDVGKKDSTGFYVAGTEPTAEAEELLKTIGVFSVDEEAGGNDTPGTDDPIYEIWFNRAKLDVVMSGNEYSLSVGGYYDYSFEIVGDDGYATINEYGDLEVFDETPSDETITIHAKDSEGNVVATADVTTLQVDVNLYVNDNDLNIVDNYIAYINAGDTLKFEAKSDSESVDLDEIHWFIGVDGNSAIDDNIGTGTVDGYAYGREFAPNIVNWSSGPQYCVYVIYNDSDFFYFRIEIGEADIETYDISKGEWVESLQTGKKYELFVDDNVDYTFAITDGNEYATLTDDGESEFWPVLNVNANLENAGQSITITATAKDGPNTITQTYTLAPGPSFTLTAVDEDSDEYLDAGETLTVSVEGYEDLSIFDFEVVQGAVYPVDGEPGVFRHYDSGTDEAGACSCQTIIRATLKEDPNKYGEIVINCW